MIALLQILHRKRDLRQHHLAECKGVGGLGRSYKDPTACHSDRACLAGTVRDLRLPVTVRGARRHRINISRLAVFRHLKPQGTDRFAGISSVRDYMDPAYTSCIVDLRNQRQSLRSVARRRLCGHFVRIPLKAEYHIAETGIGSGSHRNLYYIIIFIQITHRRLHAADFQSHLRLRSVYNGNGSGIDGDILIDHICAAVHGLTGCIVFIRAF